MAFLSRRHVLALGLGGFGAVTRCPQVLASGGGITDNEDVCRPTSADDIYYDQNGLIVQQNCDGGDTAQREGMYWLGQWVLVNALKRQPYGRQRPIEFTQVMKHLEYQTSGRFRRHPTQTRLIGEGKYRGPINDPKTTSRDQVVPLIAAMGVHKDFVRLDRFRDRLHTDHYWLNKDYLLFYEEFMKRALDRDLLFGGEVDKEILDKAVDFRRDKAATDKDDVGDDLNLIVQLLLAAVRRGDKIEAVRGRYVRERPVNYGVYLSRYRTEFPDDVAADKNTMIGRIETGINMQGEQRWKADCTNVLGALKWYFRAETGASPGLVELYRPILDEFFWGPVGA
jgi:hypothetical protein